MRMPEVRSGRAAALLIMSVFAGALLVACAGDETPGPTPRTGGAAAEPAPEVYAAELVDLTNAARAAEGLDPLAESECARTAGLERAAALVGRDDLTHAPLAPVIKDCAPLTMAAENLVNSSAEPADVVDAWLGSPGHRANIVDPALTQIGIGCIPDGEKLLCSQVFLGP